MESRWFDKFSIIFSVHLAVVKNDDSGSPVNKFVDSHAVCVCSCSCLLHSLTVTASCSMDLTYFPMDRQICSLEIESCEFAHSVLLASIAGSTIACLMYEFVCCRSNI